MKEVKLGRFNFYHASQIYYIPLKTVINHERGSKSISYEIELIEIEKHDFELPGEEMLTLVQEKCHNK